MAIERDLFRIVPDPQAPGRWAFIDNERGHQVGGFKTAKSARQAYERERRQARP